MQRISKKKRLLKISKVVLHFPLHLKRIDSASGDKYNRSDDQCRKYHACNDVSGTFKDLLAFFLSIVVIHYAARGIQDGRD